MLGLPLLVLAAAGCGREDVETSADCAVLVRLDGVVYADTGRSTSPGAPGVGEVVGTGERSSCNGTDVEGIPAGPYFAEDAPEVEVRAVEGLDPPVVVAVRDAAAGTTRYLVSPDAPPADVDAAMTAIGAGSR